MMIKVFILFCAVVAVLAYPYPKDDENPVPQSKTRLYGEGGGNKEDGYNIKLDGRTPLWESDNGRHQVDLTAGYSQHLGGPYGNSPADHRFGGSYTFRF